MKTKIAFFTVMAVVILTTACVGVNHLGVYDDSVPEDQRCLLEVDRDVSVHSFNNEPVTWSADFNARIAIYLPPGNNTFATSVEVSEGKTTRGILTDNTYGYRTSSDHSHTVSMEFLPGHSYRISRQKLLLFKINGVIIRDVTPKS